MDAYDFVQLVVFDVHSNPRGRLVAKRRISKDLEKGIGLYNGLCYPGIEHTANESTYFGSDRGFGNAQLVPILDTLVDNLPSSHQGVTVGQVICDFKHQDGTFEPTTPRRVAQKQIKRLQCLGFEIQSSTEVEFQIFDKDGHPLNNGRMDDLGGLSDKQDLFLEMITALTASGVPVDTFQIELEPGQYEATVDITKGLQACDIISRFKSMSKTFFQSRDLQASFMPKIALAGSHNGFHFNHSILGKNGENIFIDVTQPHRFSQLGKQWLAGLIRHTPALTALYCPTVNCYRCLNRPPWSPVKIDWGVDSRTSVYRLVTEENNVYIEVRMPSSASSPYLVMAGVVAAGMDGVKNGLVLEEEDLDSSLPRDLECALQELEKDDVLVQALGKDFVECFTYVKRTFEIDVLKKGSESKSEEEKLELEKNMYFKNC